MRGLCLPWLCIASFLLLSCAPHYGQDVSPQVDQNKPQQPTIAEQYAEGSQTIATIVGKEFVISLKSNPTTGYNWEPSFDAAFLQLVATEFRQAAAEPGVVGAGGEQRFTFRGLKAGTTEVWFVYKRPWEQGVVAKRVFTVCIQNGVP